jgi:hypothetical protein
MGESNQRPYAPVWGGVLAVVITLLFMVLISVSEGIFFYYFIDHGDVIFILLVFELVATTLVVFFISIFNTKVLKNEIQNQNTSIIIFLVGAPSGVIWSCLVYRVVEILIFIAG